MGVSYNSTGQADPGHLDQNTTTALEEKDGRPTDDSNYSCSIPILRLGRIYTTFDQKAQDLIERAGDVR